MRTWFDLEFSLAGSPMVDPVAEPQILWIDIETRKVRAPRSWSQKMRWQPFMIGMAQAMDPGILSVEVVSGAEDELIEMLEEFDGYQFRYDATREFDEMVLRGRFTNARRAHSKRTGSWRTLRDDVDITWKNIRKTRLETTWHRAPDCLGVEVPSLWQESEIGSHDQALVAKHCLRDVIENVLRDADVRMTPRLRKQLVRKLEK